MNRNIHTVIGTLLVMIVTALTVVSCGGGGGSSFAGIDRLGVSSGSITGFGSIFVNGVEWDTSGATITVNGSNGTESQLKLGQVVTVRGTLHGDGTGDADSVDFENSLVGPISVGSIDLVANTFIVLDQTVIVSVDTEFDDSIPVGFDGQRTLADLNPGDVVEVSGYRDSTGAVRATRIEIRSGGGDFEVRGVVSNLGATTFQIGTLVVDYTGAPPVTLANGDSVEVEGTLAGAVLMASSVQLEDSPTGDAGDEGEVEGYITRFVSATDFDVAGVPVTTDGGTQFEGGTAGSLALNVKVEVEGAVNASGVIVADKVDIRVQPEEADVEIVGDVDTVNVAQGAVTIAGMGVVIRVNEVTRYIDESSAGLVSFSLADLMQGDHVEIRGAEDSSAAPNDMVATRLKRESADDEFVLQGSVQAINHPDLSILGVTVQTDFAAFLDADGNGLNDAQFFAAIATGSIVKAKAVNTDVSGNQMAAFEAQIEEIDD